MSLLAEKYIPFIEALTHRSETREFALEVLNKTYLLIDGKISKEEFNDGVYLSENNEIYVDDVEQAKRSINHIKRMIALG